MSNTEHANRIAARADALVGTDATIRVASGADITGTVDTVVGDVITVTASDAVVWVIGAASIVAIGAGIAAAA